MEGSIRLFTIRGIAIRMHLTFPLILIWSAIQFGLLSGQGLNGAIFGVIVTLLLFAIVVLHELGHSVAAQYYGVTVKEIVLLPIGGVAQLARIPEKPLQEFVIAIAGPMVNFVLAALMVAGAALFGRSISFAGPGVVLEDMIELNFSSIFTYIFGTNLFLGIFNLLPAFPMDGGRILRALLAVRLDYARATRIAAAIGQSLAWLLGLWGFLGGGFFIILIAFFIYMGAGAERQQVELRHTLRGLNVSQAYSRQARWLTPDSTVQDAVNLTLSSFQSDFPVCDGEKVVGLLPYSKLVEALGRQDPALRVREVMLTDFSPADPREGVFAVQQRMAEKNLDSLPVVEGGRFLGLITNRDIGELYRLVSSQPELVRPAGTR